MSIGLQTFRKITNGFARGHHFNLGIIDLKAIGNNQILNYIAGVAMTPLISTFCSSMTLPSKIIQSEPVRLQQGIPPINIAKNVNYSPWSVTFYSDELLLLRFMFIQWMEKINSSRDKTFGVPASYKSQLAYASILSPADIPTHAYTFYGLYPSDVQGVTVNQSDTSVLQFTVEFLYDYFVINELKGWGMSMAHEMVTDFLLAPMFGQKRISRERSINAPYNLSVKLPF